MYEINNHKATHAEWNNFIDILLNQLQSGFGKDRIAMFRQSTNFFEGWLQGEVVYSAQNAFHSPKITMNTEFYALQRLDVGIKSSNGLCAIEIKHIPTLSKEAKYRILGPKGSNVVKDFSDLARTKYPILTKIIMLIGPVANASCQTLDGRNELSAVSLETIMNELKSKIAGGCDSPRFDWKAHKLCFDDMFLVEIDVPNQSVKN